MNNVAILPKTIMYLLQNQNVKREVAKKVETTPSIPVPVPVVADSTAPPTASATAPVSEEVKSEEVGGTNISDLNTTPSA
jgi:hypothetical protein